jgi:hypothetical protein
METISQYPATPSSYSQTSHVRTTQNPTIARNMHAPETSPRQQQPLSAPASQESFVSLHSDGSSVRGQLQSSSSNLSQLTNYTDPASPVTSAPKQQFEKTARAAVQRQKTPENTIQNAQANGEYAFASPMSVTSPAAVNGAKRTVSGHVKAPSLSGTPVAQHAAGRRSRAESISSTGSRAGELAATLKTRLGYAMAKVQHGWEHKNIAEVEQLAANKLMSPNRHSMSHVDYGKRPVSAGLSNGFSRVSMNAYDAPPLMDGTTSPPSKRRSGTFGSFMTSPQQPGRTAYGVAPHLQPAADLRPGSSNRSYYSAPSSQQSAYSNVMSPPRTPLNGHPQRPTTIRTDTQTAEAEREALQALFQLGSPHASQVSRQGAASQASQASSNQASPMLSTPRRVTFARSESGGSSAHPSSREGSLADLQ